MRIFLLLVVCFVTFLSWTLSAQTPPPMKYGFISKEDLEMKPIHLPAERYDEWRNFCRDVAKSDAMKVVLVNKT